MRKVKKGLWCYVGVGVHNNFLNQLPDFHQSHCEGHAYWITK